MLRHRLCVLAPCLYCLPWLPVCVAQEQPIAVTLETEYLRWEIGADGRNAGFVDKRTGTDYLAAAGPTCTVTVEGKELPATGAAMADGLVRVQFERPDIHATLRATARPSYVTIEVVELAGEGVTRLTLCNLSLKTDPDDPERFAACVLAQNLLTNVPEIPGPNELVRAWCDPQFGAAGASAAILACPLPQLRGAMQQAVSASPDLPQSPLGGPWAMDARHSRSSYLFNFNDLTEATVDTWIDTARSLGFNQIQMHGGTSFRFGDCFPNPNTYPGGIPDLKRTIDRLHEAGIIVGMQPYAFFIAKNCPWVTPVPHPGLAKDARFTLAADLDAESKDVPVLQSTEKMSTITGFFVRNSVTVQIDDELIVYTGLAKTEPFAFTGCARGAYGTTAAPHKAGAEVHHLKECFGLFAPDPDSDLLLEVVQKQADFFNECGFDAIYLDALDGEDVLGGAGNSWHYGSKYVFELHKRLARPAVMEMSTFHHHLWFVRSRIGAWDYPNRSHKEFIDQHVRANRAGERMFLPGNLGWWAFKNYSGAQGEPTFADDIEYLCCKALATDSGLSMASYDPNNPGHARLAAIVKQYEELRHAGTVPEPIRAQLRLPASDFTLQMGPEGPEFSPTRYDRHRVRAIDGQSNAWAVANRFEAQPLKLRMEALQCCAPYGTPEAITLADFSTDDELPDRAAAEKVTFSLRSVTDNVKVGKNSALITADSTRQERVGSWLRASRRFSPPMDLSACQAMGVWVHGDGKGEILNLQLRSPSHLSHATCDHTIPIDFEGWRYFELVEFDTEHYAGMGWPYGGQYATYRENLLYKSVESLWVWVGNLPPGEQVNLYLSPIKALPIRDGVLDSPVVQVANKQLSFDVQIPTGSYMEFGAIGDCKVYGPQGQFVGDVAVKETEVPLLAAGDNQIQFTCTGPEGLTPRARVTVITTGEPLR